MFSQSLVISLMAIFVTAQPVTISTNSIIGTKIPGSYISGVIVNEGVFVSLFDFTWEFQFLQVNAGGGFFVTETNGINPLGFSNDGTVSIVSPEYVSSKNNIIQGDNIINNGRLFYSNLATTTLYATKTWQNTGVIVISGPPNTEVSSTSYLSIFSGPITNTGVICLINQEYEMSSQLIGGGCVHVIGESTFYFNYLTSPSLLNNTILLDGSAARFIYTPCGGTYMVAGYGGGNTIEVQILTPMQYEYDSDSGNLIITAAGHTDYFKIGSGYNASDFDLWGADQALTYTGPVPNPPPTKCGVCPPIPVAPSVV